MAVLKSLRPGDYHVTLIAPETYNTFTPLLPCKHSLTAVRCVLSPPSSRFPAAAVGTVQVRSLIEPLRKVLARLRGHFIYGKAVDLAMSDRLLEVETVCSNGDSHRIYLP